MIGGQAISFWALYYEIPLPQTDTPALTQDIDFKGGSKQAKLLADSIGASMKAATMDDATASTAFLVWEPRQTASSAPRRLIIDFLSGVLGVRDKDVVNLAVTAQIEDLPPIKVLHPLPCMQSRFANLAMLAHKRDSNGIAQAALSIEIVRKFISKDAKSISDSAIARAMARTMDICTSPPGIFVFHEFGLDGTSAIDLTLLPKDHPYRLLEHPKLVAKLESKREIDTARRERRIHLPKSVRTKPSEN